MNRIYQATSIFICVPPHYAERWTILSQWARAQLYAQARADVETQTSPPTSRPRSTDPKWRSEALRPVRSIESIKTFAIDRHLCRIALIEPDG